MDNNDNVFKLETTFSPPDVRSPLYVTVTYNMYNSSMNYIWATATLYFIVHPNILSYLSLLICYIGNHRIVHLELQLPEQCSGLANDNENFCISSRTG